MGACSEHHLAAVIGRVCELDETVVVAMGLLHPDDGGDAVDADAVSGGEVLNNACPLHDIKDTFGRRVTAGHKDTWTEM